jgi:hypothetical protein
MIALLFVLWVLCLPQSINGLFDQLCVYLPRRMVTAM